MDHRALFLKFWTKESNTTRKVLSKIPENSTYRPDPKSRTAQEIAWLIVQLHVSLIEGLEKGVFEWVASAPPPAMKDILAAFDRADVVQRAQAIDTAGWERQLPFMMQGQAVMNEAGYEYGWGFLFDIIHHRGQITTYLRAMGSTVPQIYGPSADEPM